MAKNLADLDTSITNLETAFKNFQANPPISTTTVEADLTNEVARVDAVTTAVVSMTTSPVSGVKKS